MWKIQVDVDFDVSTDWTYEFAFRTDKTDQTLMKLRSPEPEIVEIRLERGKLADFSLE